MLHVASNFVLISLKLTRWGLEPISQMINEIIIQILLKK